MSTRERRYYDRHERVYRRLAADGEATWDRTAFDAFTMRPFLERALAHLGPPAPGARALDVGCGTGPVAAVLADRGYLVLGIDVSETAAALARERSAGDPRRSFVAGDVLEHEGRYELVVDSHCLHCFVFDADRAAFYAKARDLLAPGGALVLETMARHPRIDFGARFALDDDGALWVDLTGHVEPDDDGAADLRRDGDRVFAPQRRVLPPEALRAELVGAGFVIDFENVEVNEAAHEPWNWQAIARRRESPVDTVPRP